MAEKRMIHKSISVSETVNSGLTDIFHMLLFSWMIPHFDDFGRMPGSPAKVKGLVCPLLLNKSSKDVEIAITEMAQVGLIYWYEVDGQKYIQAVNFEEHQTGLHKRTKSKFPEFPGISGNFTDIPPEGKGREGNRTEQKGTDTEGKGREMPAPDSNPHKERLLALINQVNIAGINLSHLDTVYSYIGFADIEVIEYCIKKSQNKPHTYLINTLNGVISVDRVTKKEQLPGAKVGEANGANGESIRQGSTSIHDQPVKGPVGLLPSKYASVIQMPKVSG